jgi:hypothetical protein
MISDDKLKQLRREREARNRSRRVEETWEKIASESGLTAREKLERLVSLTARPSPARQRPSPESVDRILPREAVTVVENSYTLETSYGQVPLALGLNVPGKVLAFLSRDPEFESLGLDSALFLDLETTGLAGGTGTVPFLVGMGYYREDRFRVTQYFLADLADEERFIREVGAFIKDMGFRSLVTYNGKAFDLPLLETRFALSRAPFPAGGLPHLDFLYSARVLWRQRYESCRLFNLAQQLVRAGRDEDIPGAEIPARYFEFLRSGDLSLIDPIIYHNQEDLLSLLTVVISGAALVAGLNGAGRDYEADASELYGAARLFETAGEVETSIAILEKVVGKEPGADVMRRAKKKLGEQLKRRGVWDKALRVWKDGAACGDIVCLKELAKYYEHKEKNYELAASFAQQGLEAVIGTGSGDELDFSRRLARLRQKMEKRAR